MQSGFQVDAALPGLLIIRFRRLGLPSAALDIGPGRVETRSQTISRPAEIDDLCIS